MQVDSHAPLLDYADDHDDDEPTQVTAAFQLSPPSLPALRRDHLTLVRIAGGNPGQPFVPIRGEECVIGRGKHADVRIDDPGLSRKHVRFFRMGDAWYIEDLGSRNGSFLDGTRVEGAHRLTEGARVLIGAESGFRVTFQEKVEQELAHSVAQSAVTDPLTGLHNRRHLDDRLEGELAYARRHRTSLSVLLLDIDHFKKINDTYGHLAGDAVLKIVGAALKRAVRTEDMVARYGGEEMAIVTRGIDARNTLILAERARRIISSLVIPYDGNAIRLTVSVGVATHRPDRDYETVTELLAAADAALYGAKRAGRNRCAGD